MARSISSRLRAAVALGRLSSSTTLGASPFCRQRAAMEAGPAAVGCHRRVQARRASARRTEAAGPADTRSQDRRCVNMQHTLLVASAPASAPRSHLKPTCASSTARRGERCSRRSMEASSDCSCSPPSPEEGQAGGWAAHKASRATGALGTVEPPAEAIPNDQASGPQRHSRAHLPQLQQQCQLAAG
jgi:hypothetical protein